MVRIGLREKEKQTVIEKYLESHKIRKVFVLYFKKFKPDFKISVDHEYVEYSDIIMYKFFYRLLEEIDKDCLVVVDECMRTQNRSDLTYNCAHHYLNQTEHRIIFEYFPFIEDKDDFMILLNFLNKGKYKGKGFDWYYLESEDIRAKPQRIKFDVEKADLPDGAEKEYEERKKYLFDHIGNKNPDTLPRDLHVFVGKYKRPYILPDRKYIARNARYNLPNVATYQKPEKADYVLDFHYRRLDFNDYLKSTGADKITFLSSGLPPDNYYEGEFRKWLERLEEFYAATGIYQ